MAIPVLFTETDIDKPCNDAPLAISSPSNPQLWCRYDGNSLNLTATGGIPPYIWTALNADVKITGVNTAEISAGGPDPASDPNRLSRVGKVAFFKPHATGFAHRFINPQSVCQAAHPGTAEFL